MKAEEDVYPLSLFRKEKRTFWDGVRNYQARNHLRDGMKKGDLFFFYHSNGKPSGIAGIGEVVKEGYPDHTAFDRKDIHYDPDSLPTDPTWFMVDVEFRKAARKVIPLEVLRLIPALRGMSLFRQSRLSVQPVTEAEWGVILGLRDYWP
jgi:predicted RNA-binding protein with PUA-like domain